MVLAYYPQRMQQSLVANSNYPPQDSSGVGGGEVADLMQYEDLVDMTYNEAPGWLDVDFLQRIPLTVNSGQVPSTQTNFPILINATFTDLIGEVEAEIRITDENNNILDYEIQDFDNSTGELVVWARQPTLKDGDIFYIYFDNAGALDAQNVTEVYDSTHVMVQHMTPTLLDSTSNDNDATNIGSTDIAGLIGRARDFDGIDDTLQIADSSSLDVTSQLTLSFWANSPENNGFVVSKDDGGADRPYSLRRNNTVGRVGVDTGSTTFFNSLTTIPDNVFFHLAGTYDGTDLKIYVNGEFDDSRSVSGNIVITTDDVFIGSQNNTNLFAEGVIDEVGIDNVARTADYIKTKFNNQKPASTFFSVSATESVPAFIEMEYEE